jgi:hypothetical protein
MRQIITPRKMQRDVDGRARGVFPRRHGFTHAFTLLQRPLDRSCHSVGAGTQLLEDGGGKGEEQSGGGDDASTSVDVPVYAGDVEVAVLGVDVDPDAVSYNVYRRLELHPTNDGPRSTATDHRGASPAKQV